MSHRRAKRIRMILRNSGVDIPKLNRPLYQTLKAMDKGIVNPRDQLPTLKELHRANVHADIPDPKPTGIL